MRLTGEQRIAATREEVWRALNDPDILHQCIPGCTSLDRESGDRFKATVEIKVGPIGARMNGVVTLSELRPPSSYRITGEGQGGTAGFARGSADISLSEDNGGTLLNYSVDAQVGGRLAQLGGRVIDATAKQLAAKFFSQFSRRVEAPTPAEAMVGAAKPSQPATVRPSARHIGIPFAIGLVTLAATALLAFLAGRGQAGTASDTWVGLSIAMLVCVAAGVGYRIGRREAPVIRIDAELLERLAKDRPN